MTLAVVGPHSVDRVDGGRPRVGGCPFYAARALRALGAPALIVVKCAAPDRPALLPPLARLGRRMTVDAVADPWTPDEVDLPAIGWVHVGPLARTDFPAETLAALARGRRVWLEAQGLVRPGRAGPRAHDADKEPDHRRSELLVEGLDERALRRLGVPEVVVTLGPRGCVVFADGIAELVRAHRVESPDPTGAGDAFAAAYLAARSRGAAPTAAARRASAVVADLLAGRAG
jgi:hypothetical protein